MLGYFNYDHLHPNVTTQQSRLSAHLYKLNFCFSPNKTVLTLSIGYIMFKLGINGTVWLVPESVTCDLPANNAFEKTINVSTQCFYCFIERNGHRTIIYKLTLQKTMVTLDHPWHMWSSNNILVYSLRLYQETKDHRNFPNLLSHSLL